MSSAFVALFTALITSVLGPISVYLLQLYSTKKLKNQAKDPIKKSLPINLLIENKIEDIRNKHKADRVWIDQFHNGGVFYPTGQSIQKFSMFYEAVSIEIPSIKMMFQNIPVSLFSKSINELAEEGIIAIDDFTKNNGVNNSLRYFSKETKCKSVYLFAIKSIDGRFLGILGIDYVKRKTKLSEEEINEISVEVSSIGGVLIKVND
jgi:hypothetical protein